MATSRTGRLFSGGDAPVELILFESIGVDDLDNGVPTALIAKLVSQCNPTSITHLHGLHQWSDFLLSALHLSRSVKVDKLHLYEANLWDHIDAKSLAPGGVHLVVLDNLKYLLDCFHLHGFARALYDARGQQPSVFFTAFMDNNELDSETRLALRSIATTVVEVKQVVGDNQRLLNNSREFQIWNDILIRILRGKPSGRANVDIVNAKFDSTTNTLLEYIIVDVRKKRVVDSDSRGTLQQTLPFRVTMSNYERRARAAVALPYAHKNTNVADTALELHPRVLQIANYADDNARDLETSDSSEDALLDDEGDELFSEDV